MVVLAGMDYRLLASLAWPIYGLGLMLLVSVHVIGGIRGGAQSWIEVGPLTFQPSEFAKLSTLVALCAFVSSRGSAMREFGNVVVAGLIVLGPMILVVSEPDLGSAMVYAAMFVAVMIVSRTRLIYFVIGILVLPLLAWFAWNFVLQDYQKSRVLLFTDPYQDPLGAGYNIIQAWISIGAGGLFGEGLAGGTQSQFNLLRVRESDFIFAHVSGMFGFVGMLALFASFIILLWRVLRVVELSRDSLGQTLAMGIFGMLFFQSFVNIGINVGLMPVAGITLPFISQGASSLRMFLMAEGILQSIRLGHRKIAFQGSF
jgi:rod shape determining protein RodA